LVKRHYQGQTEMPTLGYWKNKGVSIFFLVEILQK
jgi:hypothetical protein